jgi:hypothetical protein
MSNETLVKDIYLKHGDGFVHATHAPKQDIIFNSVKYLDQLPFSIMESKKNATSDTE